MIGWPPNVNGGLQGTISMQAAPVAPVIALVTIGTGLLTDGAHLVKITYTNRYGETIPSSASNSVTTNSTHNKILVTPGLANKGDATYWNVYMTEAGGSTYYLVAQVPITVLIYTINVADASLLVEAPAVDTINLTTAMSREAFVTINATTFMLPTGDLSAHFGLNAAPLVFSITKLVAGAVIIDPGTGNIIDSNSTNIKHQNVSSEVYATIMLRLASSVSSANQWVIDNMRGTWAGQEA